LRATGSYFFLTSLSVIVREFFLGDVVESGISRGYQLDLDGDRFGMFRKAFE